MKNVILHRKRKECTTQLFLPLMRWSVYVFASMYFLGKATRKCIIHVYVTRRLHAQCTSRAIDALASLLHHTLPLSLPLALWQIARVCTCVLMSNWSNEPTRALWRERERAKEEEEGCLAPTLLSISVHHALAVYAYTPKAVAGMVCAAGQARHRKASVTEAVVKALVS